MTHSSYDIHNTLKGLEALCALGRGSVDALEAASIAFPEAADHLIGTDTLVPLLGDAVRRMHFELNIRRGTTDHPAVATVAATGHVLPCDGGPAPLYPAGTLLLLEGMYVVPLGPRSTGEAATGLKPRLQAAAPGLTKADVWRAATPSDFLNAVRLAIDRPTTHLPAPSLADALTSDTLVMVRDYQGRSSRTLGHLLTADPAALLAARVWTRLDDAETLQLLR